MLNVPKDRIAFFIDGTNLHKGLCESYSINRIDIESFCKELAQGREIAGIYYAEAPFIRKINPKNYDIQKSYFEYLGRIRGLILRKGYYSQYSSPPVEKKTDVNLAVDMVDLCHRDVFDLAFLFSGDTDLCPAVDIVIREGKRVIIVYFDTPKRNAYGLRKHANGYFKNITRSIAEKYRWSG